MFTPLIKPTAGHKNHGVTAKGTVIPEETKAACMCVENPYIGLSRRPRLIRRRRLLVPPIVSHPTYLVERLIRLSPSKRMSRNSNGEDEKPWKRLYHGEEVGAHNLLYCSAAAPCWVPFHLVSVSAHAHWPQTVLVPVSSLFHPCRRPKPSSRSKSRSRSSKRRRSCQSYSSSC
jgi:hypothetical protein